MAGDRDDDPAVAPSRGEPDAGSPTSGAPTSSSSGLLLPASRSDHFVQYLPSNAGGMLIDGTYGVGHPLSPWTGFALMCAYALILIGFAARRLPRVDA